MSRAKYQVVDVLATSDSSELEEILNNLNRQGYEIKLGNHQFVILEYSPLTEMAYQIKAEEDE